MDEVTKENCFIGMYCLLGALERVGFDLLKNLLLPTCDTLTHTKCKL